jgi:hypothetical protein
LHDAFGAHFVEVGAHQDSGEVRVRRMLGVFAAGRILNAKTARSQMIGGGADWQRFLLAANAKKYGALSSALGRVKIEWKVRHVLGAPRKLAIVWTEHGGPEVQRPRHRGFGSRLIKRALDG